jgi:hypothetical protein
MARPAWDPDTPVFSDDAIDESNAPELRWPAIAAALARSAARAERRRDPDE